MKKNILFKGLAATVATLLVAAAFSHRASATDYTTKAIRIYGNNGELINSHIAADVQYIEVDDYQIDPKVFSVNNSTGTTVHFKMVPILGTDRYSLQSSAIEWPLQDKAASINTFYLGETEVTNALWKAVMGTEPPSQVNSGDNYPVESVSWNDIYKAGGFLQKITAIIMTQPGMADLLEEYEFCLPTEWEWEYAANGGLANNNFSYSGSDNFNEVAWFRSNSGDSTHEVADPSMSPNNLGLYDMSGNVWEWCGDSQYREGSDYYNTYMRPQRGGAFDTNKTIFDRTANGATTSFKNLGFRLALRKKKVGPETITITNGDNTVSFGMIKISGTSSYKLKNSAIEWPEDERYASFDAYSIGETEVTNALWKAVMNTDAPSQMNHNDNFPVESVSWIDICKQGGFLDKLNEMVQNDPELSRQINGRKFYLPTEWEWEYAACGGNQCANFSYSGSNDPAKVAWYNKNSGATTHEVATKAPNGLGIYDMSGNVWEWCAESQLKEASGYINIYMRPQRGGSYDSNATIFSRTGNGLSSIFKNIGFRLVLK